jgi:E3 ubiquitin-protein ligase EDD1
METESVNGEEDTTTRSGRRHPFFRRSDSTLCLGCPQPDPFALPMVEAMPLADQPHLLQPSARREELFGAPRQPITVQPSGSNPPGTVNPLEVIPTRLGLSTRTSEIHTGQMHAPLSIPTTTSTSSVAPPELVQETPQNLSLKDSDSEVLEVTRSGSAGGVASSVIVSPRRAAATAQSVIVRTGCVRDPTGTASASASSSTPSTSREKSDESQSTAGTSLQLPRNSSTGETYFNFMKKE